MVQGWDNIISPDWEKRFIFSPQETTQTKMVSELRKDTLDSYVVRWVETEKSKIKYLFGIAFYIFLQVCLYLGCFYTQTSDWVVTTGYFIVSAFIYFHMFDFDDNYHDEYAEFEIRWFKK